MISDCKKKCLSEKYLYNDKKEMKDFRAQYLKEIQRIKSGFFELDKMTQGWRNGDLITIGGRPAVGKTAFGISLLRNVAIINRMPTAFFSLELSKEQLSDRLISSLSLVEIEKACNFRNGNISDLSEAEIRRIEDAKRQIEISSVYFDDTPSLSMRELYPRAAYLINSFQIKLIIIDYLQLLNSSGLFSKRSEEVAYIARKLKTMAKDLNIPIVALSQLNRGERIGDKRPILSNFRESETIGQESDIVYLIHRPEYYGIYTDEEGNDLHGIAEIIIAKNINGNIGKALLKFNGEYAHF